MNYLKLKKIVESGLCIKCGACTIICPTNKIIIHDNLVSFNRDVSCKECGLCFSVCPKSSAKKAGLGEFIEIHSAKSRRFFGQDGGIATEVLVSALELKIIDVAIAVNKDKNWRPLPVIATSIESVEKCKFTKFGETPIFSLLPKVMDKKIGIIGPACITTTARTLQKLKYNNIKLIVGLFCTENFSYEKLAKFLQDRGVVLSEIKKIDVKKEFFRILETNRIFTFELKELKNFVLPGCKFCHDFCAVDADVSIGSSGSEEGYSTLIIRNKIGKKIFNYMKEKNYILLSEVDLKSIEKMARKKMLSNPKSDLFPTLAN